jgi:hypothetical protein
MSTLGLRRLALTLAFLGILFMLAVPLGVVYAQCGTQVSCLMDDTVTSTAHITHYGWDGDAWAIPVEPDTGETWSVTAYWRTTNTIALPAYCRCTSEMSSTVTVDVDWSSGWQASCTGCSSTGLIRDVDVCTDDGCGDGYDHSWAYSLIADIQKQNGYYSCWVQGQEYLASRTLERVTYTTTSVDDGDEIDTQSCSEDSSVSPTSQSWSTTDSTTFECDFDCDAAGPSLSLRYQ